jgi:hypothetical protein
LAVLAFAMTNADLTAWLLFAIVIALIGRLKGGDGWGWFVGGLLFGPFAFIAVAFQHHDIAALRRRLEENERRMASRGDDKAIIKALVRSHKPISRADLYGDLNARQRNSV